MSGQKLNTLTQKTLYESIAAGHKGELIEIIKKEAKKYGSGYLSTVQDSGVYTSTTGGGKSQSDLISEKAIEIIETIDGIINSQDLGHSDEEVVRKAIRDEITINNLAKTKPEGSNIGIEGMILHYL